MKNRQKNKRIEIRVTNEEYNAYKKAAEASRLSVSEWARRRLENRDDYVDNAPQMMEVIARVQTHLNKAKCNIDLDESLDNAYKEVGRLWRYLRK